MASAQALDLIKSSLIEIGYDNNKIIDNYPIIASNKVIYFDFVAFGHDKIQDTSTSCILVKYCDNEIQESQVVKESECCATPILIIPKEKNINIWRVNVSKKSEKIWELQYDELGEHFALNRVKLDYNLIVSSKVEWEQLSFFSAKDLFQYATKVNCELLGKEFKKAIDVAKTFINVKDEQEIKDITSVTMHIIAAKILNDKLVLGERYDDINKILDLLSTYYSDYFNKEFMYKYGSGLVDKIYQSFRSDLSYRSIDNKILGNFYENTLFENDELKNKQLKQELGIYYTPISVVNNMVEAIPFELLDFRNRYVLDGSCGSGSLLIGAYKRLISLLPKKMDDELKHKYLTNMIMGIDIDKFACEVARLEMLLTSVPYGNGWKVYNEDLLKINNMQYKPSIIIANPPFKEERTNGKQIEKATLFLEKYIELLNEGGFIAIIMPESFLENKSGKIAREKLLCNINIFEIWCLPKGIFDTNNCATTVIVGQKVNESTYNDGPFVARIVSKNLNSINMFKTIGQYDFNFVCKSQKQFMNDSNNKIMLSPISSIIEKIDKNSTIKEYVNYTQGIQIPFKYNYPLVSDQYIDGYSKFFRNARYGFDKYRIDWNQQRESKYIMYDPDNIINKDFVGKFNDKGLRLRETKRDILESKKVIMTMNSTPGTFWRTKAAIDYEGIYPSHSFWCLIPNNDRVSLEVIAALINSTLANLYIGNKNRALNIKKDIILSIPMPKFSDKQLEEITGLVGNIEESIFIDNYLERIDEIIYRAFNLTNAEIDIIKQYYSIISGCKKDKATNTEPRKENVEITGITINYDFEKNCIHAMIVESEDIKYIHITEDIPGWLLDSNVNFTCIINEEDLYNQFIKVKHVKPLDYVYLEESEFNNLLNNDFYYFDKQKNVSNKIFVGGDLR